MNRAIATATLLIALSSSGCGSGTGTSAEGVAPSQQKRAASVHPVFAPGDGWQMTTAMSGDSPVTWVANVNFSDADAGQDFPDRTIATLPAGGIVLVAVGPRAFQGEEQFPRLTLPMGLADGRLVTGTYEGQPAPTLSYFYADERADDQTVLNVWGYFGGNPPSMAVRTEADRVLATLRLDD